ncbi:thioredoxin-like domain-containing protein [Telluribacter sp. SYSU D00476]|uniref:TlpA family protein disulfide reductase n=1 Tax=Telluribacter sp. SYSU D00476 TaxID=2811430 RepID=UPI001FF258CC|nr:thioredoxin-like domain-containing protein [Telluribacter sp. SYSU D00476]
MKIYKVVLALLSLLIAPMTWAQNTARVTIIAPEGMNQKVSLTAERVRFHETLGMGLADTEFDNLGVVDLSTQKSGVFDVELDKPTLVRMTLPPSGAGGSSEGRTHILYLKPGDNLTVKLNNDRGLEFSGSSAAYQQFLRDYYRENHYQYLPAFSYKPTQVDNQAILKQSDSLQQLRRTRYNEFKSSASVDKEFDAYVQATSMTEPYLLQALVMDRDMRKNRPVKLTPDQQKKLTELTLQNFKPLPDEALMNQTYRNELRNWIQLQAAQGGQASTEGQNTMSAQAIEKAYQLTQEKLKDYPRQREYLSTYWLNQATTVFPTTQTARTLLAEYKKSYPQSQQIAYFEKWLNTKDQLKNGTMAPDVTLMGVDSTPISISSLRGNPMILAFAFNLKQHEPSLKALEESHKDKVNFVYVSVAPGIPFTTWKQYAEARPGVMHLWASEKAVQELKEKYAITHGHPFVLIDAQGRIANRWIPMGFPESKTLQAELDRVAGR